MPTAKANPMVPAAHRGRKLLKSIVIGILFALAAAGGTLTGLVLAFQRDLPIMREVENYRPSLITQVLADNNEVIAEFAVEKRVVIDYQEIPEVLRNAIVASEDQRFWRHHGFDPIGITRALWDSLWAGRMGAAGGASTITQQVSRMLFLTREFTLSRKIKEAILAFKIERAYTKEEILTYYCNLLHFAHGLYGVQAASEYYFDKDVRNLKLEEAALMVGLAPSPDNYSPFNNPEASLRRRNIVLQRMENEKFITPEQAEQARNMPLQLRHRGPSGNIAPYFVEEVRQYLEQKYGSSRIYRGGLRVHTTLNKQMQIQANTSIDRALRSVDKRQGFRSSRKNVLQDAAIELEEFRSEDWNEPYAPEQIVTGLVTQTDPQTSIKIGRFTASIDPESTTWTKTNFTDLFKKGDIYPFKISSIDSEAETMVLNLEQEPLVEGSLLALEVRTGHIKAMVGGFDFERSKFNRATQARRQPGSAFKAFTIGAAVQEGYTATSLILDEPVRYVDPHIDEVYEPKNYDREFEGWITLRRLVEGSRNVPAVRLTQQISPQKIVDYAKRLGLSGPIPPYLSVTLGVAEATLLEMVSAYSAFANQGIRMQPTLITKVTDQDGNILEETHPHAASAIRADSAYIVTNLLRGVIQRGTGIRATRLGRPLAGKTGTTNDYTDAWFLGFDPTIATGTWIGFDQKLSLGERETGARVALPPWIEFMEFALKDKPVQDFPVPANIVFVPVNKNTGYPALTERDPETILESFISGTEPSGYPGR